MTATKPKLATVDEVNLLVKRIYDDMAREWASIGKRLEKLERAVKKR